MPNDSLSPAEPDTTALAAENARLRAELHTANIRASLQALRAAAVGGQAHTLRNEIAIIRRSSIWRLTLPLRLAIDIARGLPTTSSAEALLLRHFLGTWRRHGLGAALARVRARRRHQLMVNAAPPAPPVLDASVPPAEILQPLVLIIAELSIRQCAKYRVWQKQEHFARLGIACRVVDWHDIAECQSAVAVATQVIFYRVPARPLVLELIALLRRLKIPMAWEVDDLIFDRALYLQNQNLQTLDPALLDSVLSGIELYRATMLACGAGIASTPHLAEAMRAAGLSRVDVVENALDEETLTAAAVIRARPMPHEGVLIAYGSGTKTHDADFRVAAGALLRLLRENPSVRLRIIGDLNLPAGLAAFGPRVEHLPPAGYTRYLELLGEADISIAPLEPTLFNDAKSNIKFLEAAILSRPSVCSPAANFAAVIEDGVNGLLAAGEAQWFSALERLAADAGLRARMGEAALATTLSRYAPEKIAHAQAAALVLPARPVRPKLRILMANVFFAPRSFGGATLVVEALAARLRHMPETDVHIVTTLESTATPYALRRMTQDGMQVFAIPVNAGDVVTDFDDPLAEAEFLRVLDALQPDVVHLHSIQSLSAGLARACHARGIPYVITLHDSWWLCGRQFMVRADGTYCHQVKIDRRVCESCMPGARHLEAREILLHDALAHAALLLSPSEAHRQLYIANGVPPARIITAPNGVRLPAAGFTRRPGKTLRFAFVGGDAEVKGYSLVRKAFESLASADWELVLVDNTLNLGYASLDTGDWRVRGRVTVVPAYTPAGLDEFFAGVDVLLFPSQWKESFGLTVREALARDVWVIATDGGGPAEAITDGVNGTLLPLDGRFEPLADAIAGLIANSDRLRGLRNPHAGAIMDFDAQAVALHATLAKIVAANGKTT
jgi:glycosyltransferase involved in cell wall biosynthesis